MPLRRAQSVTIRQAVHGRHRLVATLGRAEGEAAEADASVAGEHQHLCDQVDGNIDALAAVGAFLLAVLEHQGAFVRVDVAGAQAQHLGDAAT
jgi:hypothetical protein